MSALAAPPIEAMRQLRKDRSQARHLRRAPDSQLGGAGLSERDIRGERVSQHQRRLQYHRDIFAQRSELDLAKIVAFYFYRAPLWFIKPRHQACHGSFSSSARSNDRDRFPRVSLEADSLENRIRRFVSKHHVVELDLSTDAAKRSSAGTILYFGIERKKCKASPQPCLRALDQTVGLKNLIDRRIQRYEIGGQYRQFTDSDLRTHDVERTEVHHQRGSHRDHHADCTSVNGLESVEAQIFAQTFAARLHKLTIRFGFAGERLHHVNRCG